MIKLFEEYNEKLYKLLDIQQYNNFRVNHKEINFDYNQKIILKEYAKGINMNMYCGKKFKSENEYVILICNDIKLKYLNIDIQKFSDEYYFIKYKGVVDRYVLCDQWDGFLEFLSDLKEKRLDFI